MKDPTGYFKEEGKKSLRDGDFDDAIMCFEKAIGLCPTHADSLLFELQYLLAYTETRQQNIDSSMGACIHIMPGKTSLKSYDTESTAQRYFRVGRCYYEKGDETLGKRYLTKAKNAIGTNEAFKSMVKEIDLMLDDMEVELTHTPRPVSTKWKMKRPAQAIVRTKATKVAPVRCVRLCSGQISRETNTPRIDCIF